jgi:hypothetical protein
MQLPPEALDSPVIARPPSRGANKMESALDEVVAAARPLQRRT